MTADLIRKRNLPWWKACVPFPALGSDPLHRVPPAARVQQVPPPPCPHPEQRKRKEKLLKNPPNLKRERVKFK